MSNNWNERGQHEIDRQGIMETRIEIKTLGSERCENIGNLCRNYVNKKNKILGLVLAVSVLIPVHAIAIQIKCQSQVKHLCTFQPYPPFTLGSTMIDIYPCIDG